MGDFNGGGLTKTDDTPSFLLPLRDLAAAFASIERLTQEEACSALRLAAAVLPQRTAHVIAHLDPPLLVPADVTLFAVRRDLPRSAQSFRHVVAACVRT
jgi:hypothetical protein